MLAADPGRPVRDVRAAPTFKLAATAVAAVLLGYLVALLLRFHGQSDLYLSYFTDDFYYYVVIAQNLAHSGLSSFNGEQLTNGYHPLWLLVMTGLTAILGSDLPFFFTVTVLIWVLVASTFVQLLRASRLCSPTSDFTLPAALFSTLCAAVLARTGMEISIALLFLTTFYVRVARTPLELQAPAQAMLTGLVASLAVLSRIDACIGVAAYLLCSLISGSLTSKRAWLRVFAFGAGALLVVLYLVVNHYVFGTWLPISGMAKNLKHGLEPSAAVLARLVRPDVVNALLTWPAIITGVLYAVYRREPLASPAARVRAAVLLHPPIFYLMLTLSSDWTIWTWYLYPLVPIVALVLPHLYDAYLAQRYVRAATWATAAIGLLGVGLSAVLAMPHKPAVEIYQAAKQISQFGATHPGRYAMGDRAGTPGFLLPRPLFQLEGLVADLSFLERLKRRQPLLDVLRELDIDYYVATNPERSGDCYMVREPGQAGTASPTLDGRICDAPVSTFHAGELDTLIFAMKPHGPGAFSTH